MSITFFFLLFFILLLYVCFDTPSTLPYPIYQNKHIYIYKKHRKILKNKYIEINIYIYIYKYRYIISTYHKSI